MKLPPAEEAIVPRDKTENYLLDLGHPIGGAKAAFFMRFGFKREAWSVLGDALAKHARDNPVADSIADADGITYVVEGILETPSSRRPTLRSVWLVETDKIAPRFITAYPLSV